MSILLEVILGIWIVSTIATFLAGANGMFDKTGLAWVNPIWIYQTIKVNWFGAIFLALIANIIIPHIAICYWIYKLCTVGRRQDNGTR